MLSNFVKILFKLFNLLSKGPFEKCPRAINLFKYGAGYFGLGLYTFLLI
jgi:hypothetical protein